MMGGGSSERTLAVACALALAAAVTAARAGGAPPRPGPAQEKELRRILADFAKAADDDERARLAESAVALGADAAARAGAAVRARLDQLIAAYARDLGARARALQAEHVLAASRDDARALVRVLVWREILGEGSDDVVKKRVGAEGAPALEELKGLLIVPADASGLIEGELGEARAAILALGGVLDRCRAASGEADAPKVIGGTEVPKADAPGTFEEHLRRRERAIVLAATVARSEDAQVILANENVATELDLAEAEGILELNTLRVLMGLSSVAINPGLSAACRDHSNDMKTRGFFSHVSPVPGKQGFGERAKRYGAGAGGECIAAGTDRGPGAIHMWLHSPGHMRIMMGRGTYSIGLGRRANVWTLLAGGGKKRPHPLYDDDVFVPGVDPQDPASRARLVMPLFKAGRVADALRGVEKLKATEGLPDADRVALRLLEFRALARADEEVERLGAIDRGGDVYALAVALREARAGFASMQVVEDAAAPLEEKLKGEPAKKELRIGAQYHQMAAAVRAMKQKPLDRARPVIAAQLEQFAKRNEGSVYAPAAREAARRIRASEKGPDPFEAHFKNAAASSGK